MLFTSGVCRLLRLRERDRRIEETVAMSASVTVICCFGDIAKELRVPGRRKDTLPVALDLMSDSPATTAARQCLQLFNRCLDGRC